MEVILISLGALLYCATVADIMKTALSLHAGGWLTTPFAHGIWMLFLKLSGANGRSRVLEHAGYISLGLILLGWVLLLWISFFLLLLSQADSIVNSTTGLPADAWEKIYYAGFTISTLGVGDYVGSANVWRILTAVYSFTGLIFITLSITYFFSVLSGVINERQLGITLASLGRTPQDIVLNSWNGTNFQRIVAQSQDIASLIIRHSENYKAYPVIHYFHTRIPNNNAILRITTLYEALLLFKQYVNNELRPDQHDLALIGTALDNYIAVIGEVVTLREIRNAPEKPDLKKLIHAGLVEPNKADQSVDDNVRRQRRLLATLVEQDGWSWEDIS